MKILLICYDIHPLKGGESAVAWNIATRLAKSVEVTIITRPNNINECNREVAKLRLNIKFLGYDLPKLFVRLKGLLPGGIFLYCTLWQYTLAKKLQKCTVTYDLVHSVNFVSDTIPCFIYRLRTKTVWGPISHHEPMPFELISSYTFIKMQIKLVMRQIIWAMLLIRNKKKRFDLVLHSNSSVSKRLGSSINSKHWPSTGVVRRQFEAKPPTVENNRIKLIYAARMTEIKGWSTIIQLIRTLYLSTCEVNVHLDLIGDGPLFREVKNSLDVYSSDRITWQIHGRLSHARYQEILGHSDVYVCPSFEGGGIAVAEAMSFGLPVVCFDNYGPGETVGTDYPGLVKVRQDGKFDEEDFCEAVIKIIEDDNFRSKVAEQSLERVGSVLDWDVKVQKLLKLYRSVLNEMT